MKAVRLVSTTTNSKDMLGMDLKSPAAVPTSFRLKQHVGIYLPMMSGYRMQTIMDSANVISRELNDNFNEVNKYDKTN